MTNSKDFMKEVGKTLTLRAYVLELPGLRLSQITGYPDEFHGVFSLSNKIISVLYTDCCCKWYCCCCHYHLF